MFVFACVFVSRVIVCVCGKFDLFCALRTVIFIPDEPLKCHLIRVALFNYGFFIIIANMMKVSSDDFIQAH